MNVILASGSPRRRALLENLGWNARVIVPEIDETPLPFEPPENLCVRLSAAKAAKIADMELDEPYKNAPIIAADTIVVTGGRVLGKPSGEEESLLMLKLLQGKTHEVLTGVTVIGKDKEGKKQTLSGLERTKVTFRPLDDAALAAYAATGEGADKAGAYAIQGKGALLAASIEGDYFNVVGLPMCRLGAMLEEIGLELPLQWS